MFGFLKRENPQLQLYGKLPLAKDYLRLGLGDGPELAVREWLDATFSGAASRESVPVLAGPMRFLAGEAWRTCLQGVLVPSSDAGGHRPFPFLLCVGRRRRAVLEDLQRGLVQADGVWRDLDNRRERCAAHKDGRSLLAALRGSTLDVDRSVGAAAGAIDVEAWLQALWPERGREGLESDLERLAAAAAVEGSPIRLPLAAGGSQRQQVLAWLEILERVGALPRDECPTVFLPMPSPPAPAAPSPSADDTGTDDTGPQPFLTVLRTPAAAWQGRWLAAPGDENLGPGDLVGGRPPAARLSATASETLPPLAASLRSCVSAFLRRAGGA